MSNRKPSPLRSVPQVNRCQAASRVAARYAASLGRDPLYHVALSKNVPSILRRGLLPAKPGDMADVKGVYLFKNKTDMEDALMNWLGDRFPEDARLTLLRVDPAGVSKRDTFAAAGFEVISKKPISPDFISVEQGNL